MRAHLSPRSTSTSALDLAPRGVAREALYLTGLAAVVGALWFYGSVRNDADFDFTPPSPQATAILKADLAEAVQPQPMAVADARLPAGARWPS